MRRWLRVKAKSAARPRAFTLICAEKNMAAGPQGGQVFVRMLFSGAPTARTLQLP
jgi:hypothetical protein